MHGEGGRTADDEDQPSRVTQAASCSPEMCMRRMPVGTLGDYLIQRVLGATSPVLSGQAFRPQCRRLNHHDHHHHHLGFAPAS